MNHYIKSASESSVFIIYLVNLSVCYISLFNLRSISFVVMSLTFADRLNAQVRSNHKHPLVINSFLISIVSFPPYVCFVGC